VGKLTRSTSVLPDPRIDLELRDPGAAPVVELELDAELGLRPAPFPPLLPARTNLGESSASAAAQPTAVPTLDEAESIQLDDATLALAPTANATVSEQPAQSPPSSHVVLRLDSEDGWGATVGGRGGPEEWRIDGDGVVPGRLDQGNPFALFGGVAYTWQSGTTFSLVGGFSLDRQIGFDELDAPTRLLQLDEELQPFVGVLLRARF
jgi:hypothetical protein